VLQLSKYPALNNFEKSTSVPKVYAILGLAGLYFFLIFFNIAGEFLVNIAGFIIPSYYSLNALFSASKVDDTQVRTLGSGFANSSHFRPVHVLTSDSGSHTGSSMHS
jgi:receptor expression-enhancing protein 5/6